MQVEAPPDRLPNGSTDRLLLGCPLAKRLLEFRDQQPEFVQFIKALRRGAPRGELWPLAHAALLTGAEFNNFVAMVQNLPGTRQRAKAYPGLKRRLDKLSRAAGEDQDRLEEQYHASKTEKSRISYELGPAEAAHRTLELAQRLGLA